MSAMFEELDRYLSIRRVASNLKSSVDLPTSWMIDRISKTANSGSKCWTPLFQSIIELANLEVAMPVGKREVDVETIPIHRDALVLVQNPEFIQLPEGIMLKGIPLVVRLKANRGTAFELVLPGSTASASLGWPIGGPSALP
jgi:hypothetical protein